MDAAIPPENRRLTCFVNNGCREETKKYTSFCHSAYLIRDIDILFPKYYNYFWNGCDS